MFKWKSLLAIMMLPCFASAAEVKKPGVLIVAGFQSPAGALNMLAKRFEQRGFVVAQSPVSDGTCSQSLAMVKAAYRRLIDDPRVNSKQVMLFGTSLGAYTAARLAADQRPKWLVLHAPANYPDADCAHPITGVIMTPREGVIVDWRKQELAADATASLRAVARYGGPALVVASEHDRSVPLMTSMNYLHAAARGHLSMLPGASHELSSEAQERLADIVFNWRDSVMTQQLVGGVRGTSY